MKWLLALHLIAVICWLAGLFYLPRLFVYHAATDSHAVSEQFKIMEGKLFFYITNPAALVSIISGLALMVLYLAKPHAMWGWLITKLLLVALLLVHHVACGYHLWQFSQDRNRLSHKYYRYFNEAPTLLMIAIVILAVVKPF